jgi:predicted Zn-dependent protease
MTSRRRCWLTAVLMSALAVPAGAASFDFGRLFDAGKDVTAAARSIDEKEEIEIGREVAGRTLGAAPLVAEPELQAYVNRVGRWIAMQTERPDLPWHFGVLDTASVNAFAAPGGYALITRGLYDLLDSEAQLAGVLGHEIGHIVQRHHIKVMQQSAAVSAGARLAQRDNRSQLVNNAIGTGAEVLARGLDKDAEFEADRIGMVLAARAGYSPYGPVEVLHRLSARAADDVSLALQFKTHPAPGEHLTQLGDALAPRGAASGRQGARHPRGESQRAAAGGRKAGRRRRRARPATGGNRRRPDVVAGGQRQRRSHGHTPRHLRPLNVASRYSLIVIRVGTLRTGCASFD